MFWVIALVWLFICFGFVLRTERSQNWWTWRCIIWFRHLWSCGYMGTGGFPLWFLSYFVFVHFNISWATCLQRNNSFLFLLIAFDVQIYKVFYLFYCSLAGLAVSSSLSPIFHLTCMFMVLVYALQLICYSVSWLLRFVIVPLCWPESSLMLYQMVGRTMHGAGLIKE